MSWRDNFGRDRGVDHEKQYDFLKAILDLRAHLDHRLNQLDLRLGRMDERLDKMNQDIQDQVAAVADMTSVAKSIEAGMDVISGKVTELEAKIVELQGQIGSGTPLTPEDLAALKQGTTDLKAITEELRTKIPANTPAEGEGAGRSRG